MLKLCTAVLAATAAFACEADYLIWIPRSNSADPLYRFEKNGKTGYIDSSGRVLIPPQFEVHGNYGDEFHDRLLEIAVSDGRYVDSTGKLVIDKNLYRGWDFSEGLAVAMRKGENVWGYIDKTGAFAITPRFETFPNGYVYPFSEGLAMIEAKGKFGYIDPSGGFVIPPQFLAGRNFSDGMARVVLEGPCIYMTDPPCAEFVHAGTGVPGRVGSCRFTYIGKTGQPITQPRFDQGRDFSEGLAPVRLGEQWGYIDKSGGFAVPPKFDDAYPFSLGLARIWSGQNQFYGYIDKAGSIKIEPQFAYAEEFSDGFAVVGDATYARFWYIDQNGKRVFGSEFALASRFFKGLAHVKFTAADAKKFGATFAYIDRTGRRVFTY